MARLVNLRQLERRQREDLFDEDSDPSGSRNGSTEMRSYLTSSTSRYSVVDGNSDGNSGQHSDTMCSSKCLSSSSPNLANGRCPQCPIIDPNPARNKKMRLWFIRHPPPWRETSIHIGANSVQDASRSATQESGDRVGLAFTPD